MALDKLLKRGLIIGGLGLAGLAAGISGLAYSRNNIQTHPDAARLDELNRALNPDC